MDLGAQYISRVLEYVPAPGQFTNSAPWGWPSSAQSIEGGVRGTLSLGAFGGYVVFRFDGPVENDPGNPYGVDFSLFGNPLGDWSEPGVVFVMKDENGNGQPDDRWYELAGSDYHFLSSNSDYHVTYTNPGGPSATDVPWSDNLGNTGFIMANSSHNQPYFPNTDSFPQVGQDQYTLKGSMILGAVDVDRPPVVRSLRRAFGYADNQARGSAPYTLPDNPYTPEVEHSGGDAFDIGWAVDSMGRSVQLDQVDFIRVQTGILHKGGFLGEISTEISGGVDVPPVQGYDGSTSLLVVRELPVEIDTVAIQLEVCAFEMGIPQKDLTISWSASEPWATVDKTNRLTMRGAGPLVLTASLDTDPSIMATVSTLVVPGISPLGATQLKASGPIVYPNPAKEYIRLRGTGDAEVTLLDLSGKVVCRNRDYQEGDLISLTGLQAGIYLVGIHRNDRTVWRKIIKN